MESQNIGYRKVEKKVRMPRLRDGICINRGSRMWITNFQLFVVKGGKVLHSLMPQYDLFPSDTEITQTKK